MFKAADHVFRKQAYTTGFVHDRKTGAVVKYSTPYTRKSGDANTSSGNSVINLTAAYNVYK